MQCMSEVLGFLLIWRDEMQTGGQRQLCSKCSIFGQKNAMFFPVSLPVFVTVTAVWNPKAKLHLQSESHTAVLCTMVENNCHKS